MFRGGGSKVKVFSLLTVFILTRQRRRRRGISTPILVFVCLSKREMEAVLDDDDDYAVARGLLPPETSANTSSRRVFQEMGPWNDDINMLNIKLQSPHTSVVLQEAERRPMFVLLLLRTFL